MMHVPCTLYAATSDYQWVSFAFFGFLLPLVAKNLLRIRDYDGFSGDLQVVDLGN